MQLPKSSSSVPSDLLLAIREAPTPKIKQMHIPDKWVASSLLQKAIRRGQADFALAAGSFLHQLDPRIVWRRLPLIGWEDVSFGDLDACCNASQLARNKRLRTKLGGDWHTAAWFISRFCGAPKNRITDDLVTVLEHAPSAPAIISQVSKLDDGDLRRLLTPTDRCILRRAAATWLLCGTDKFPSEAMPARSGDLAAYFRYFARDSAASNLAVIGEAASKSTKTIFPALTAMLWEEWSENQSTFEIVKDQLNWNATIGDVPAYAYDGHTAKGSRYLRKLGRVDAELAIWLIEVLPAELHVPMLKKFAFRSVASLCNQLHNWGNIQKVRTLADSVGFHLEQSVFAEGMELFRTAASRFPIEEIG
ncbi:hypothetical protein [Pontixanthobacter sp. CEM42]|uniref:hypothetical protein n=1 Tax=Pontixanthobacter sp. CEM42 TaxID=2792077 RepID=UPI001AE061E7|nr:hypothetical protein [Pontixanthobacter sp. CEM42]